MRVREASGQRGRASDRPGRMRQHSPVLAGQPTPSHPINPAARLPGEGTDQTAYGRPQMMNAEAALAVQIGGSRTWIGNYRWAVAEDSYPRGRSGRPSGAWRD